MTGNLYLMWSGEPYRSWCADSYLCPCGTITVKRLFPTGLDTSMCRKEASCKSAPEWRQIIYLPETRHFRVRREVSYINFSASYLWVKCSLFTDCLCRSFCWKHNSVTKQADRCCSKLRNCNRGWLLSVHNDYSLAVMADADDEFGLQQSRLQNIQLPS